MDATSNPRSLFVAVGGTLIAWQLLSAFHLSAASAELRRFSVGLPVHFAPVTEFVLSYGRLSWIIPFLSATLVVASLMARFTITRCALVAAVIGAFSVALQELLTQYLLSPFADILQKVL
jgi:hypothetical protein